MNLEFEDDQLRQMMSKADFKMPFDGFEKDLMILIKSENKRKRYLLQKIRLSWIFFGLGMIAGIILTIFLSRVEDLIMGIDPEMVVVPLVFCLSMVFLLLMERLVKFSLSKKSL